VDVPKVTVNDEQRSLDGVAAYVSTLAWLRSGGLTGVKEGCAEGECGACAVMVARPHGDDGGEWTALNSCLVPALALSGCDVVTAEGLGTPEDLHPAQREMAVRGGSQCGYCTPGFVCSMAAEYYRPTRTDFDLHAIAGNLCRCTGYRPIRDAALALGTPDDDDPLVARAAAPSRPAAVRRPDFVRPASLPELLDLLAERPEAVMVAGSTDWGVEANLRGSRAPVLVAIDALPELRGFELGESVRIGAALSLTEVERRLDGAVPLLDQLFWQFASRLIRNAATLGGNLGTASPIGDSPPALLALEADVVIAGRDGVREVPLAEFFTGYRETALGAGEVITAVRFARRRPTLTAFHKIAKRRLDDISSVAVAYALDLEDGVVARARIGLGGVAATPLRALATEAALEGEPWNPDTVERAARVLAGEGTPMDDHRASAAYRSAMLGQSLRRLFHEARPEQQEVGA